MKFKKAASYALVLASNLRYCDQTGMANNFGHLMYSANRELLLAYKTTPAEGYLAQRLACLTLLPECDVIRVALSGIRGTLRIQREQRMCRQSYVYHITVTIREDSPDEWESSNYTVRRFSLCNTRISDAEVRYFHRESTPPRWIQTDKEYAIEAVPPEIVDAIECGLPGQPIYVR